MMRSVLEKLSLLLLLALALTACVESDPEHRPATVPQSAAWVGGSDGGVFVEITQDRPGEEYELTVYYDSGGVWYQGLAVLQPEGGGLSLPVDASLLDSWDGDTLYLSDGRYLEADGTRE